ncbi:SigB/SigF/SigG family RNA polymerase sigma factor [Kribbella endophytica]
MLTTERLDITSVPVNCSSAEQRAQRDAATRELLRARARCDDDTERQRLLEQAVELNIEIARGIARRFRSRGAEDDDLEQVACLGLMKAANGYDADSDVPFIGYAVPTIRGEVKRYFRDCTWTVRIPRTLQELQGKIARALPELTQELGREPTLQEIATHLRVNLEDIQQAEAARGCFNVLSLDRPVNDDDLVLGDIVADDEDPYLRQLERVDMLGPVVADLPPRDRRILELRFIENMTQADVGRELGVSQMQVSRLLSRILADLRARLEPVQAAA